MSSRFFDWHQALARRMDVAYSNAERLVRTELNAVENRASAAAMRDAEFEYYQFMATLDRRTCARCGEHDGEIYRLSEMQQGENAPPLHARCRCTIVASLGGVSGGQRFARDDDNKRSRVPADMTYSDWRAVYIERTKTLETWRRERNAKLDTDLLTFNMTGGRIAARGLAAGDNANVSGTKGISPYYIGSIDFKDAVQIQRVLDYFEPIIALEPVENAIIITTSGDIYHCTGTLNTLETIEELGDKLHGAIVTHNHPVGSVNEYSFSEKDRLLFEKYKLTRLRGIDERFVYELNQNLNDVDDESGAPLDEGYLAHSINIKRARFFGYGYRRWSR